MVSFGAFHLILEVKPSKTNPNETIKLRVVNDDDVKLS